MKLMPRIALAAASFFFFAYAAYGQQAAQEKSGTASTSVQTVNNTPRTTTIDLQAPSPHEPVITGEPYSVEVVFERVQTLADGTHITQRAQSTKRYRDSQGRTRIENSPAGVQVAEIHDSVSGFRYLLDLQNHV